MTDKEKIKKEKEIEKEMRALDLTNDFDNGRFSELNQLNHLKLFIDSLPEEPASEDLAEEIKRYINEEVIVTNENAVISKHHEFHNFYVENLVGVARHFANWQKQQMMKDAVDGLVKGLYSKYIKERDGDALSKALESFRQGDKVKIIIVKENNS